jgi:hypothetical protein
MRPDTNQSPSIGDHFGLFFADEPWAHHMRYGRIVSQLRIKAGMGDDDRSGRDLEHGFRRLHIGMGKIDEDAQPIAFFDDGCAEWAQSAVTRSVGINVSERHGSVGVVKQPKMPQPPPVAFFHSLKVALEKVAAFDRLDDRWQALLRHRRFGSQSQRSCRWLRARPLQLPGQI